MYTKVFLDPIVIHQQASAQDLSNSGFSSIFTGVIRQNRELGIKPDTAYLTGIIITYTRKEHKSGSRCAQHSSDFICTRRTSSPSISCITSGSCIKPLPLIRLSFVFKFFSSGADGQDPSVFLGQLRCFASTFASLFRFFSEGLIILRRSRELGTLYGVILLFLLCCVVRNQVCFMISGLQVFFLGAWDWIAFNLK